jgi:hypothetical protein
MKNRAIKSFSAQPTPAVISNPNSTPTISGQKAKVSRGLFVEFSETFHEVPDRINILPKPHVFMHPFYGEIRITEARNMRFISNFKNRVYMYPIPIDAEHELKLSGAVGWLTDLVMNEDGSVDGVISWTERGLALMEGGGYRFFSPEWIDEWPDPAKPDQAPIKDVLIGGAICTRPFFKEPYLRPLLVANSDGTYEFIDPDKAMIATENKMDENENVENDQQVTPTPTPTPQPVTPATPAAPTEQFSDAQIAGVSVRASEKRVVMTREQFTQLTQKFAAMEGAEQRANALSERLDQTQQEFSDLRGTLDLQAQILKKMSDEARDKDLKDIILGKSEQFGDTRLLGDHEKLLATMKALQDADKRNAEAGTATTLFADYVNHEIQSAKDRRENKFTEIGTSNRPSTPEAEVDMDNDSILAKVEAEAKKYMEADPNLTIEKARDKFWAGNEKLYRKYSDNLRRMRSR